MYLLVNNEYFVASVLIDNHQKLIPTSKKVAQAFKVISSQSEEICKVPRKISNVKNGCIFVSDQPRLQPKTND